MVVALTVLAAPVGIALYLTLGGGTASPVQYDYSLNSSTSMGVVQAQPWDPRYVESGCGVGCVIFLSVAGASGR